jgi:N-acetylmuramoyl-L-alanine amidase
MKKTISFIMIFLIFINVYAYGATGYTNISNIALYNNASYDSGIKDTLKMSSKVEILQQNNEWCKVATLDGQTGWIEKYFITLSSERYVVNNTAYNINIRTSPTTGSKIAGQLKPGDKADYIDTYHSWHIIKYDGGEYYIASWFTDIEYKKSEKIYFLYDSINIRNNASLDSKVIAQGNSGDSFEVVGEEKGWYKIVLKDNSFGYVAAWLTSHDISSLKTEHVSYKKTTDDLNIRTGPSAGYDRILTLKRGETVKTVASENGWDKIVTQKGYVGWCNNYYLKEALPLTGKVILLDPGHGGHDPGAISYSGKFEKYINLSVARNLKELLNKAGAAVYMTRTSDTYITNKERGRLADKLGADILLSIHHNSLNNNNYFGLSTYYNTINYKSPSFGYDLAEAIYLNAITINGVYRDGILDRNFEVLRETNTPAALIEIGFMSNPTEEMNIHNISFQNVMVEKIADGIIDYFQKNNQ